MAKLYFKFGAMGSSKTAQALMTKFNYEEKDKTVWLIKPAIDTRDDRVENGRRITEAKSRIGLAAPADAIAEDDDLIELFTAREGRSPRISMIWSPSRSGRIASSSSCSRRAAMRASRSS